MKTFLSKPSSQHFKRLVSKSSKPPVLFSSEAFPRFFHQSISTTLFPSSPTDFIRDIKTRGVLNDATSGFEQLVNEMANGQPGNQKKPIGIYAGFDPTASGLHVGNLLVLQTLKRFQKAFEPNKVHIYCLVGGATGRIGDPSGRKTERPLLDEDIISGNIEGLKREMNAFFSSENTSNVTVVNNADWLGEMKMIDLLRNVGKYFQITNMLRLESVKSRLENADAENAGMTFTEFSYSLFQSYDFYYLFNSNNVRLQIGGSDQWGNITSGLEFIKKKQTMNPEMSQISCSGMTIPLLTTADGVKFGKSMGNAVWLNPEMTSPFDFYQYFMRVQDADVEKLLKVLTFVSVDGIEQIMNEHKKQPEKRIAQQILADQLTQQIHGTDQLECVKKCSQLLYGSGSEEEALNILRSLSKKEISTLMKDSPSSQLPRSELLSKSIVDIAVSLKLGPSKAELSKLIKNGGFYINYKRQQDPKYILTSDDFVAGGGTIAVLRLGKKNFQIIEAV
ncbi:hypothetical protein FDP41_006284 [Naegleria fowleri]|uniref:Tyrosine--tRNA ligase n=1 Tax=Naegleria fowleri TaxID=5763 RepID=A0A6A5BLC1_NAEFO|nr:uncharacterized protein FDP41_006284 [Naegleria fowleri]KAF0974810.1 hypothetical protein FDP41_006284 [Naegleria fowleri]CAG4718109.1 unnamed protein product [Naegleria fowleri]